MITSLGFLVVLTLPKIARLSTQYNSNAAYFCYYRDRKLIIRKWTSHNTYKD